MTRGNLLIVLVLILALVGMFFWTLTLHNRQAELYDGGGGGEAGPRDPDASGRIGDLENEFREVRLLIRSNISDLNRVEGRVAELERARDIQDGKLAALAGGGPPAIAGSGSSMGDAGLKDAVEAVLAEKAAADRKARSLQRAQGFARYLLAEIDATDQQQKQLVTVVATYIDERDRIRREAGASDGGAEARDAALARTTEERNEAIRQLFPSSYTKIEERLDRTSRRWGSSRGTGNRAAPRGTPR